MSRWLQQCTSMHFNTDWNKYDDRLMKAVERGEVEKVSAVLSKKGITPTKLDVEGRSAFHLAATRGHLECLNQILGHNVDITATDATGKNALHLASRNGHSLCVQKLLQHNCPVGNVDLQGRTALHDAVMAGCTSSVKLLTDSGASVNASDFDGRTPLVLATQMCHPHICKLLLERGADTSLRDKQNKTALILGCEYGCKDAVEVLLRSGGGDVLAVDGLGHDAYHYARLNKNQELLAIVKTHLDNANRVKEAAKLEQRKRQHSLRKAEEKPEVADSKRDQKIHDLERQNESQQESLRKFQQEQRNLLEQIDLLNQQLTQDKLPVEDGGKEPVKKPTSGKEREDGPRAAETVKVQLRNTVGDYSGQSVIKGKENLLSRHSRSFDSAQIPQNTSATSRTGSRASESGPPGAARDPAGETDGLRRELDAAKKRLQASEDERTRLQSALSRKSQECQEVAASREALRKQGDQQVRDLEGALGDVQTRMVDSECKVKQLQAHVVAVKERLGGGQAAEELRSQLQEVKAKYEGASAEVGRVRNRLKQSEKALEEYKGSEGRLATEAERLGQELGTLALEREELARALQEAQARLQEAAEAKAKPGNVVPAEKFDNMKNLLTNAVDEKERQLAELREDYDRVLEEVAELHRAGAQPSPGGGKAVTTPAEEHERIRAALDEQNASLKRRLADVTSKSQELIREVEESEEEREILREQLDELSGRLEAEFVPLREHEAARLDMARAMEELEDKVVEAGERSGRTEAQLRQLEGERAALRQEVAALLASAERHAAEMEAAVSQNTELAGRLEALREKCAEREEELARLTQRSGSLERRLDQDYVSRERHEQATRELSQALEVAAAQISKLESKEKESAEELRNVTDGSGMLQAKLERVLLEREKDCVRMMEHEDLKVKLSAEVGAAESKSKEVSEMYASSREENRRLNEELEAQKKELDTIHEAIASKFVPRTTVKEEENSYNAKVQDLTVKLSQMEERCNAEKSDGQRLRLEAEKLHLEMESLQQRLGNAVINCQRSKDAEVQRKSELEEAVLSAQGLERQYQEEAAMRAKLEEKNALDNAKIHSLETLLQAELARTQGSDAEQRALRGTLQQTQAQCQEATEGRRLEAQRSDRLREELLRRHREEQEMALAQHARERQAEEAEAEELRTALRLERERAEDAAALRSELLLATRALEEHRAREERAGRLEAENRRLEEEVAALGERLAGETRRGDGLQRDAEAQAREAERRAGREARSALEKGQAMERESRELTERCDQSQGTIQDLQRKIRSSAEQVQVKDKKIAELLSDVERLKQALSGLSQLAYVGTSPHKRHTQHIDTLQGQLKSLEQQLADTERQHREVVSIYRTHLLSAAQGHMDEDVQAALLQIIRMRQEFVC